MPRSGPPTYTYTLPPIYLAVPGTTITAAQHNDPLEDIASTFNSVTPIVWGGTGASSAAAAIAALGGASLTSANTFTANQTIANAAAASALLLREDPANGSHKVTVTAPASLASDKVQTLQDITGTLYVTGGTDVAVADGGTGFSSYTVGDMLYASAAAVLSKLAAGTAGQALVMNAGATAPNWASSVTLGTPVASTSGTSIDFTGIPSWVRRITLTLSGVSTSGTSSKLVRLGDSGGIESTGYLGSSAFALSGGYTGQQFTTGAGILSITAADILHGTVNITLVDASTNTWVINGLLSSSSDETTFYVASSKSLSATLDRVRLTTTNGTDTFDAGKVNITYS